MSKRPVLRKKLQTVSFSGSTVVPAEARVLMGMLVADNGAVLYVGIMKASESLLLNDAAVEAAKHCQFSPALGPDGKPVTVWVMGTFTAGLDQDSLAVWPLGGIDSMTKADGQNISAAPETVFVAEPDGSPSLIQYARLYQAPVVVKKVDPIYSAEAKALGIAGKVSVLMLIDVDGRVIRAKVRESSFSDELDRSAIEAVRQWLFTPAIVHGGKPVYVWKTQTFIFK